MLFSVTYFPRHHGTGQRAKQAIDALAPVQQRAPSASNLYTQVLDITHRISKISLQALRTILKYVRMTGSRIKVPCAQPP